MTLLRLREVPSSLMASLVASPHLFVMQVRFDSICTLFLCIEGTVANGCLFLPISNVSLQTEFSVYVLLRLWMFLQLHPAWDGEPQDAVAASQTHFKALHNTSAVNYFLECPEAAPFLSVFRNIRLPHLINHHMDVEMLVSDKIVPDSWMSSTYYARWMTLLRLDCGIDKGPQNLDEDTFDRECLRCGRTLNTDGQHIWRWTGFNSGLDLIITYDNYRLTMKVTNTRFVSLTQFQNQVVF